jgi:fructose-bisphosphate aldolase class I
MRDIRRQVGVENTEENRRAYRQMLFEAPGCNEFLCAAILDPETVYQKSSTSGKLFPEVLTGLGIVPGIKPHLKVYAIPGQAGSTVMQVSAGLCSSNKHRVSLESTSTSHARS